MKDETFLVDTNIIVYAYDTFDTKKHEKCKNIVETAFKGERKCAVTNQILAELFFVLTRKLRRPFSTEEAETIVLGIVDSINWSKVNYDHETVKSAILLSKKNNISIWDSLVISTALENGITKIYTENVRDFKEITGLSPINPMK